MEQPNQERFFTREWVLAALSFSDGETYVGNVVYEHTEDGRMRFSDRLDNAVKVTGINFLDLHEKIKTEAYAQLNRQNSENITQDKYNANKKYYEAMGFKDFVKDPLLSASHRFTSELKRLHTAAKEKTGEQGLVGVIALDYNSKTNPEPEYFITGVLGPSIR